MHATHACGRLRRRAGRRPADGPRRAATVDALGIAGSSAGGLLEFLATGSSTKQLHPGLASHAGILAARLAAAGADGPDSVLEGEPRSLRRARRRPRRRRAGDRRPRRRLGDHPDRHQALPRLPADARRARRRPGRAGRRDARRRHGPRGHRRGAPRQRRRSSASPTRSCRARRTTRSSRCPGAWPRCWSTAASASTPTRPTRWAVRPSPSSPPGSGSSRCPTAGSPPTRPAGSRSSSPTAAVCTAPSSAADRAARPSSPPTSAARTAAAELTAAVDALDLPTLIALADRLATPEENC